MSNIIDAIINLVNYKSNSLLENTAGNNRANNSGDGLEEYVKDLFAGTFNIDGAQRLEKISNTFSYLGNNSNPPDAMLREGDAIEVKKIESPNSALALNSSYPKNKLQANSPMISQACKDAEIWKSKDIMYIVGFVQSNRLKQLSIVYGMDYCADESCYLRIKNTIKESVESIPSIEFAESRELGHINKVDPLGITYMRVRGMWGIENPWKVFSYVYNRSFNKQFSFMCIINNEKWATLGNTLSLTRLAKVENNLTISDIRIKDPNNPAHLRDAKLISFSF
ncbi:MAG: NgoPII family restriction endonuclease [Fibrobacter sp.]|nr:NgoPII family restriction endonuclease [Fibrobacter sp.]